MAGNVEDAPGLARARELGLAVEAIPSRGEPSRRSHEEKVLAALRGAGAEWVCLAGYMRRLSPDFLAAFPRRIVNIHPSLLPAFPGLDAQAQAVAHGVKVSGCTVHLVDEVYDRGAILGQARVPVLPGDDPETLAARVLEVEHRLLPAAVLAAAAAGRPVRLPEFAESNP